LRSAFKVLGFFVGRSTLDIVYACACFPDPDGKVDAETSYMSGGGPALNGAVAFAALGGRARVCSVLGRGPMADWVRHDVVSHGVELFDAAAGEEGVLPVSSVILTGSSRAIVNQPLPVHSPDPEPQLLDRLFATSPDIVLSDGHLPELAIPILRRAREAGVTTVLDGGSWKPWTAELMAWIDIAIVSSRFRPPPEGGLADPLELLRRRARAAAVTNGAGPIRWAEGESSGEITPQRVEAVDTLGAGDIFHGAFCHAFAGGEGFRASLEAAAAVASRSCTSWGPRGWMAEGA
jgi:sugar/nucleoside kinase (ribokinase family)